jgi:hypothetical protein
VPTCIIVGAISTFTSSTSCTYGGSKRPSQPRGSRRSEGTQNTPWEPLEGDAREDATLPLHLLAIAVL